MISRSCFRVVTREITQLGDPRPFNSLMEIPAAIEKVLVESGVKLHIDWAMSKYIE